MGSGLNFNPKKKALCEFEFQYFRRYYSITPPAIHKEKRLGANTDAGPPERLTEPGQLLDVQILLRFDV